MSANLKGYWLAVLAIHWRMLLRRQMQWAASGSLCGIGPHLSLDRRRRTSRFLAGRHRCGRWILVSHVCVLPLKSRRLGFAASGWRTWD